MSSGEKKRKAVRGIASLAAETQRQLDRLADAHRRLLADRRRLGDGRVTVACPPQPASADPLEGLRLSPRARQILTFLLNGETEKQIADKLQISPHTVHTYVKRLHKTLGVRSRNELLARFVTR